MKNLLLFFIAVQESVIYFPLKPQEVRNLLAPKLGPEIMVSYATPWNHELRYSGYLENNTVHLEGPFGNRQWCVISHGEIRPAPQGAALYLNQHFRLSQFLLGIGGLLFYLVVSLVYFDFGFMWHLLVQQVLFLYLVILLIFRYQAAESRKIINRLLIED